VESVTYGRIDTIFRKLDLPAKNMRFNQYSCGFYDFEENAIFGVAKDTFFVITLLNEISAFEAIKTGVVKGRFLPAPRPSN
jgi:hypothetical protein